MVGDSIEQLLLKAVTREVESRLNQSLHNRIYIELDKEKDLNFPTPGDMELVPGKGDSEQLPDGTRIESVFDRSDVNGRLLILGAPGSGKTVTLLQLARTLLSRAVDRRELPVPVLLSLSSWKNDKQSIAAWIAEALKTKYGLRIDIGRRLVKNARVLPLLDELDELASDRQELCTKKINEFLQQWPGNLVACSRIEEYRHYTAQLDLQACVVLQPLRSEQIRDYVTRSQGESLWQLVGAEPDLLELAQNPLMLGIIVISHSKIDFNRWQQLASSEERVSYLFNAYLEKMLSKPRYLFQVYIDEEMPSESQEQSSRQAYKWLGWLATKLAQEKQTEFIIEKIQPSWLENPIQKLIYGLIYGLLYGLTNGILNALLLLMPLLFALSLNIGIITFFDSLLKPIEYLELSIVGLTISLVLTAVAVIIITLSVIGGLSLGLIKSISLIFKNKRFNSLLLYVIYGVIGCLVLGTVVLSNQLLYQWLLTTAVFSLLLSNSLIILSPIIVLIATILTLERGCKWLVYELTLWLIYWLTGEKPRPELDEKIIANKGMVEYFINFLLFSAISYIPAVALIFIVAIISRVDFQWYEPFLAGLSLALFFCVIQSRFFIEHFALRLVLYWNGYAPWNYKKFLDFAADRLLMQRVGGRYRFLHEMLRQHLADRYEAERFRLF